MGIKDDDTKVNTTARYFIDFAFLWQRHKSIDEKCGQATIGTWKEF